MHERTVDRTRTHRTGQARRLVTRRVLGVASALTAIACGAAPISTPSRPTPSSVESRTPRTLPIDALRLPEPTGEAAIGVRDLGSVVPGAIARIWYPSQAGTGSGAPPYLSPEWAAELGVRPDLLDGVVLRAAINATPAPADFPRPGVVLMPGLGTPMALSTSLTQDLVSNGYVVLTLDPIGDSNQLAAEATQPMGRLEQLTSGLDFMTGTDVAALAGPIDPTRIAAGGHSLAGADAIQASLTDSRIAAAFDLDGWLHGPALETPAQIPTLFVEASGFDQPTAEVIARSPHAVTVRLVGATHFDVTDAPCLAPGLGPVATQLHLGPIGCAGVISTNALVERFLSASLIDGVPLLDAGRLAVGLEGIQ